MILSHFLSEELAACSENKSFGFSKKLFLYFYNIVGAPPQDGVWSGWEYCFILGSGTFDGADQHFSTVAWFEKNQKRKRYIKLTF